MTVNMENIALLKKTIIENPEGFDMGIWNCNTIACIGGWCERLANKDFLGVSGVAEWLGLDVEITRRLTHPATHGKLDWSSITVEQAIRAIDYTVAGGDPDEFWQNVRNMDRCGDCQEVMTIGELDSWASHENAPQSEVELCKPCHDARPASAWGPWCEP